MSEMPGWNAQIFACYRREDNTLKEAGDDCRQDELASFDMDLRFAKNVYFF